MALSQQLRDISRGIRAQADTEQATSNAQAGAQTQQMIGQAAQVPQGNIKQAGSQIAAQATQAVGQGNLAAKESENQMSNQLAQTGINLTGQQNQNTLNKQQQLNDSTIRDMQRDGQLRQNSEKLRSNKMLGDAEIASQQSILGQQMAIDNSISFLTRKQREDLAELGNVTKNYLFDQRLTFGNDEAGRKFTNGQQLADYAVLSAENEQDLQNKMKTMIRVHKREEIALTHAHNMIAERMKLEFKKAESTKDYALLKKLSERKAAAEKKIRRKAAKAAANKAIIVGAATIAGTFTPIGGAGGAGVGMILASQVEE